MAVVKSVTWWVSFGFATAGLAVLLIVEQRGKPLTAMGLLPLVLLGWSVFWLVLAAIRSHRNQR
jgi:hypothetical protein